MCVYKIYYDIYAFTHTTNSGFVDHQHALPTEDDSRHSGAVTVSQSTPLLVPLGFFFLAKCLDYVCEHTKRERERERQIDRQTDRQTDRHTH